MSRAGPIHPSAIISEAAELAEGVEVGPFAIIGAGVKIAKDCRIEAQAHLMGEVTVGEGCRIGRAAIVGEDPQDLSFSPQMKSGVLIGSNNVVREHVTIHRSGADGGATRIGDDNYLMVGSHLAHDVVMGDGNVLANNVLLAGHVEVGSNVFLGGGTVVHQFIRLGDYCLTQGNSAISKDIPPYVIAYRLNRFGGMNVVGLRRAGFDPSTRIEIRSAFDQLFRSDLPLRDALVEARKRDWSAEAKKLLDFVEGQSGKGVLTATRR